jgi:hypothetical protein
VYFGDRVRGTVGEIPVELTNFNGQLHGQIGKYPVYATYYNGSVSAHNGVRYLSLHEFGRGFSGWVGQWSVNISWFTDLSAIQKIALIAVVMTEMTPTP